MKYKLIVFGFFIILAGCKSDISRLDKVVNQLDQAEGQFPLPSKNWLPPVYKTTKYHHVELETTQIYLCFLAKWVRFFRPYSFVFGFVSVKGKHVH